MARDASKFFQNRYFLCKSQINGQKPLAEVLFDAYTTPKNHACKSEISLIEYR